VNKEYDTEDIACVVCNTPLGRPPKSKIYDVYNFNGAFCLGCAAAIGHLISISFMNDDFTMQETGKLFNRKSKFYREVKKRLLKAADFGITKEEFEAKYGDLNE